VSTGYSEGILMMWPFRDANEGRRAQVGGKSTHLELQTTQKILAEIVRSGSAPGINRSKDGQKDRTNSVLIILNTPQNIPFLPSLPV
jgi:hypothetical protein